MVGHEGIGIAMAEYCHDYASMELCAAALRQRNLPHNVRHHSGDFNLGADAIQVMAMKVSKTLEFSLALPGVGHVPAPGKDEQEAAGVFYVAATRATQRLVMGVGG